MTICQSDILLEFLLRMPCYIVIPPSPLLEFHLFLLLLYYISALTIYYSIRPTLLEAFLFDTGFKKVVFNELNKV